MSTCPANAISFCPLAVNYKMNSSQVFKLQKQLPSSPLATSCTVTPSSPILQLARNFNATPPSSPTKGRPMILTISSPPSSPNCRKVQMMLPLSGLSSLSTVVTSTPPTPTSIPSNIRDQPVARPMLNKSCKKKLGPGCGLLDWIRLCRNKKVDLTGTGGEKRPITLEELAKHNTESDAWTSIRGKVYNLTYYMKFHPGGKDELMKGAGMDCTILFDEVHKWVNVETTLKACYVGPLVIASPNTQRKASDFIVKKNLQHRKDSLGIPKTVVITDGINSQAVSTNMRKNSMTLRNETQAATACEETDGDRQISPESPVKNFLGDNIPKKTLPTPEEASSNKASIRLALPPTRIRRNSEPHPRFDWVQSEKAVTIHVITKNVGLKTSDVVLDVNGLTLEASIFIYGWIYELRLELAHKIVGSQVNISNGRVEISLKKEVAHVQWESIGTFLEGHAKLSIRNKRGIKYHTTHVERIKTVTHDTILYTLRLPVGSYLNVPTGHHLSIKAIVNGEEVERKYTPVSSLETSNSRNGFPAVSQEGSTIDLIVKLYKDGKMSRFLSQLKEGDEVVVSDPEGTFDANRLKSASEILLIAAGSGFTPMVKILRDFLSTELVARQRHVSASEASGETWQEDQLAPELPPATNQNYNSDEITSNNLPKSARLVFANKKEKDIMWQEELDHLVIATAERFRVTHILSDCHWPGPKRRIGESLLKSHLPSVNPQNPKSALVCVCGPEPFMADISNMLLDMDYPDQCIQCFQ